MDKLIHRVRGLVERGERLSAADCRALFDLHDLNEFSRLSRIVRERRYGKDAFYRAVEVFEYRGEHPDLFFSELETVASGHAAELALKPVAREGLGPEQWLERLRGIAAAAAASSRFVSLRPSAGFVAGLAGSEGKKAGEILSVLREAIPVRLSGNGAELFDEAWRARYAPGAVDAERWLAVHQAAHEIGMKTDAAMTFHTGWDPAPYAAHLETLRTLQDRTGGFHAFVPTAFHDTDPDARYRAVPSASMILKTTAIARLFLDNIPHIIAAPGMNDPELSYVALSYGADTIDPSIRPSDLESMHERTALSADGGLPVLSDGNAKSNEGKLALPNVEERIIEARWKAVPVDGAFERIAIEEIEG